MNSDKTREAIAVMQAYVDGKQIQVMNRDGSHAWYSIRGSCGETPHWNWENVEYRVEPPSPEPTAPEDFWIVVVKSSRRPLSIIFTSPEEAKKWIGYAGEYYDVVHLRSASDDSERLYRTNDRVKFARYSGQEEYEASEIGYDDQIPQHLGQTGTVRNTSKFDTQTLYPEVLFDSGDSWWILPQDLDPA